MTSVAPLQVLLSPCPQILKLAVRIQSLFRKRNQFRIFNYSDSPGPEVALGIFFCRRLRHADLLIDHEKESLVIADCLVFSRNFQVIVEAEEAAVGQGKAILKDRVQNLLVGLIEGLQGEIKAWDEDRSGPLESIADRIDWFFDQTPLKFNSHLQFAVDWFGDVVARIKGAQKFPGFTVRDTTLKSCRGILADAERRLTSKETEIEGAELNNKIHSALADSNTREVEFRDTSSNQAAPRHRSTWLQPDGLYREIDGPTDWPADVSSQSVRLPMKLISRRAEISDHQKREILSFFKAESVGWLGRDWFVEMSREDDIRITRNLLPESLRSFVLGIERVSRAEMATFERLRGEVGFRLKTDEGGPHDSHPDYKLYGEGTPRFKVVRKS